jgi:hypothetical protein
MDDTYTIDSFRKNPGIIQYTVGAGAMVVSKI